MCKQLGTGGARYDGRKVAEARMLVDKALRNYPELATGEKRERMERQLIGIQLQQAEKDYEVAEFYRKTDHLPSAYFYYEIVRRRYAGTRFADQATERMHEIHDEAEKQQAGSTNVKVPGVPAAPRRLPRHNECGASCARSADATASRRTATEQACGRSHRTKRKDHVTQEPLARSARRRLFRAAFLPGGRQLLRPRLHDQTELRSEHPHDSRADLREQRRKATRSRAAWNFS